MRVVEIDICAGSALRGQTRTLTMWGAANQYITDTKVGIFVLKGFLDLNHSASVINTVLWAFFVLGIGGMLLGWYAARTLKKRERLLADQVVVIEDVDA